MFLEIFLLFIIFVWVYIVPTNFWISKKLNSTPKEEISEEIKHETTTKNFRNKNLGEALRRSTRESPLKNDEQKNDEQKNDEQKNDETKNDETENFKKTLAWLTNPKFRRRL